MRPFILIAAMLVIPASVQAGPPRGLSTSNGSSAAQIQTAEASNPDTRAVDPAAANPVAQSQTQTIQGKAEQPNAQLDKPIQDKPMIRKTDRQKRDDLETRVIDGLHRHGIYW